MSEVLFWQVFKNNEQLGFDIDRQVIIGNYVVDFFISELGLVVEIDGQSHDLKGEYDQNREKYLRNLSLEVIHYKDVEIKKSMDFVADSFFLAVQKRFRYLDSFANPPRHHFVMPPLKREIRDRSALEISLVINSFKLIIKQISALSIGLFLMIQFSLSKFKFPYKNFRL